MLATFSNESKIARELEELDCSGNAFAEICGIVGRTRMAQGLKGEKDFDQGDAERMFRTLAEMRELRSMSALPLDWTDCEGIRRALEERRGAKRILEDVMRVVNEMQRVNRILRGHTDV